MKKCPRCGFYNSDERDRCLKCKSILEHDWGAARQKVRRRLPLHRLTFAAADLGRRARQAFEFELPLEVPYRHPLQAGLMSLLPGMGQIYNRQYCKALIFAAGFAALFAMVVATVVHPTSYLWIAGLLGWIFFSTNDAMIAAMRINGEQWSRRHVTALFSVIVFYFALFWSLSQFFLVGIITLFVLYGLRSLFWPHHEVTRRRILTTLVVAFGILIGACVLSRSGNPVIHRWVYWSQDVIAPTIRQGDFIYVDCLTYWFRAPRLGELVYYDPPKYHIESGPNLWSVDVENAIERVVALPGDRFERISGEFFRNGKPVPRESQPLRIDAIESGFEFDVPKNKYLVLITYPARERLIPFYPGAPAPKEGISADWGDACLVTRDQIMGRCLFIWHPVSRRQWLAPSVAPAVSR